MASSSPRPPQGSVRIAKPRSAGGALGGFVGAIIMSVVAGILVTVAVTPVVAISGITANSAISIFENLPAHLNPGQLAQPSTLYAKKGKKEVKIADFYAQNRQMVGWNSISQFAKDAAVAGEDPRFFTHGGVDVLGLGRATLGRLGGGDSGGASTITMQYVRNVLVQQAENIPDEKASKAAYIEATRETPDRKLKEMRYALSIEKKYSKNQILLGYLNIANFGGTVYGIESAAQTYYGTHAKDLTLSQAASLVGIVQNPYKLQLDIPDNLKRNTDRRDWVLGRMLDTGRITQAQYDEAVAEKVKPKITPLYSGCGVAEKTKYALGHFCDFVQRTIESDPLFGDDVDERNFNFLRGGYKIMTTIDLDIQKAGKDAMRAKVPSTMTGINVGGASVSVEVGTGRILGMVQNRPFSDDPAYLKKHKGYTSINYNTDFDMGGSSGFQVGSTFKPITLAEWIRTGHSIMNIVNVNGRTVPENSFKDSCVDGGVYVYGSFTFSNDNLGIRGNQSVRTAIANSINGGLVSMAQQLDLCDIFKMASDLGIHRASKQTNKDLPTYGTTDLTEVPSNVYGGIDEIAPLTMANAYTAFAGKGKLCTPTPIDSITGADGEAVPFTKSKCKQAISADVAAGVANTLQYTVTNGLARHAASAIGIPHLGKTGTTDDVIDNWTIGASTKVATATWVGNAGPYCFSKTDCRRVSTMNFGGWGGLMIADQTIWPAMMNVADQKYGGDAFPPPPAASIMQTMVAVPDVTGKSPAEAQQILTAAGFTPEVSNETKDSSVPKGMVAETNPGAGTNAPKGIGIVIYLSNGKAVSVPNVVGKQYNDAVGTLNAAGFGTVVGECVGKGGHPKGSDTVVSMSPGAGKDASRKDPITLRVKCT